MQMKSYLYKGKQNFLKTNDYTCVTYQVPQSKGVADSKNYNRKIVKAGTVLPANDGTAQGILFEDVEVTSNDDVGALIVRGDILKDALPETLDSGAETALKALGFRFYPIAGEWRVDTSPIPTSTDLLGKKINDLQDVRIYSDGTVTGMLKQVDGYTGFNGSVVEEQSGYYFAFKIQPPSGLKTESTVAKLVTEKGEEVKKVDMDKSDWINIVWLGGKEIESIDKKVYAEIDWKNDGNVITLNFDLSNVELQK